MTAAPPARLVLGEGLSLRRFGPADAGALATAVRESLEHLRPWMPWADESAADEGFQRRRLRGLLHRSASGQEWQYALERDDDRLLGSFGLVAHKRPATIEIGYWVHVDATGHGYATRAARALTNAALELDGVDTVCIRCDEANARSAAVPAKLGFTLARVEQRAPEAPGESGRLMIWERIEPIPDPP